MHRIFYGIIALGVALVAAHVAHAQTAPAAVPASCDQQLGEAKSNNATVTQLWRDVNSQRVGYEIQVASIRAALGQECPESAPVSQCVAKLHSQYMDLAQKHAKTTAPSATPAAAPKPEVPKK